MIRDLFFYVDCQFATGNINSQWQRIHISQVEEFRLANINSNTFTSIQFFKEDKHREGELQYVPIYFDLDYPDDVEIALLDCRALVDYFTSMDIGQEHIRVWFSGSKGFHVVITPEVFGIKPNAELTYIIKNASTYVANQLNLRSFDSRVYSIRRLWRLPGSVHQKTKLYCTELSHIELRRSLDDIREIAKNDRGSIYDRSEYEGINENPIAAAWFSPFPQTYEIQKELANLRPKNPITAFAGENPVCINDLLVNSIRKIGTRNQGEMALASYYKDTGVAEVAAHDIVREWVGKIPKGMSSKTDQRALDADVKGVIKTVFDQEHGDRYHFACHFIRALGSGTEKPIACAYDKCKFVNREDQEQDTPIKLKLPEASRAVYIGKHIKTELMVSGREDIPYGIPYRNKIVCTPDLDRDNSICKVCPIAVFGGNYEFKFSAKDPHLLGLLDTTDVQQKQFLRRHCGIPDRCNRHRIFTLEYTNVVEILAIPRINFQPDTITEEEPYVVRRAYFVGHDIESNKEYSVTAYTHPDPKSQHIVHVIDHIQSMTDDISSFTMDEDISTKLKKFQINVAGTI